MELTCPNCQTAFEMPDEMMRPQGRKVRCSNCTHSWVAYPQQSMDQETVAQVPPQPAPQLGGDNPAPPPQAQFQQAPAPNQQDPLEQLRAQISSMQPAQAPPQAPPQNAAAIPPPPVDLQASQPASQQNTPQADQLPNVLPPELEPSTDSLSESIPQAFSEDAPGYDNDPGTVPMGMRSTSQEDESIPEDQVDLPQSSEEESDDIPDIDQDILDKLPDDDAFADPIPQEQNAELPMIKKGPLAAWVLLGLFCFIFFGGLIYEREGIIKSYPSLNAIYGIFGMDKKGFGYGIAIGDPTASYILNPDSPRRLIIRGTLQNQASDVIEIPSLIGLFYNSRQEIIHQWHFRADQPTILPGEEIEYYTEVVDPPRGLTDIRITLLSDAELHSMEQSGS